MTFNLILLLCFLLSVLTRSESINDSAFEMIVQHVKLGDASRFLSVDNDIWNPFLQLQEGFVRKVSTIPFYDTLDNATIVHQMIEWKSFELWHSIDEAERMKIVLEVSDIVGYDTNYSRFPDENGLRVIAGTSMNPSPPFSMTSHTPTQAIEFLHQVVHSGDMAHFLAVDKSHWTTYLEQQSGFQSKDCLIPYYDTLLNATSCYQAINWASFDQWKAIDGEELAAVEAEFVDDMGYSTFQAALPSDAGMRVVHGSDSAGERRPVLNGYDVVMYHLQWDAEHMSSKKDVMGSPRWQYVLQTSIGSYTFWFSSPDTLALFRLDPWKYAPAYGGHCSHHIATSETLTKEQLDEGLGYAVVCINTNNWAIVNGTLYLNSCGMYYDFIAQVTERNPPTLIMINSTV